MGKENDTLALGFAWRGSRRIREWTAVVQHSTIALLSYPNDGWFVTVEITTQSPG